LQALRTNRLFSTGITLALTLLAVPRLARAEQILEQKSSWNRAHDFIYTDFKVRQDDGSIVTRRLAGGSVDGIGMVQFDSVVGAPGLGQTQLDFLRATSKKSGVQLRWDRSVVFITPDLPGTTQIAGDTEQQVIKEVLAAWEEAIGACSYMHFVVDAPAANEAKYDGKNIVKFREDTWCRPASEMDDGKCYDPAAAAITTVFYVDTPGKPNDGIIRDADIEVNGVNFAIGVCTGPGQCTTGGDQGIVSDLANTLTHEVGHLLGLDHTCWDVPMVAPPVDDQGETVPLCTATPLSMKVTEATMYNYQDSGEIKKRSLEPDDVNGVCDAYPTANDPECEKRALDSCDHGGACSTTPPQNRSGAGTGAARNLLFGLGALLTAGIGGVRAYRRRAQMRRLARA
jgi:hypothetical protein